AVNALDPYRENFRLETADVSTLLVGPPQPLFPAMRDRLNSAAGAGQHCVLAAPVSRGCPGEPDDPICTPSAEFGKQPPLAERIEAGHTAVAMAPVAGLTVAAQFSLYPLGAAPHMDEIYGSIEFVKSSGVFDRSKNFC